MKKIVCFGEVLWDMFPNGKKLGGAPLNVGVRAQWLGNQISVISSIGNDELGKDLVEEMKSYALDLDHLQRSKRHGTSQVLVHLNDQGSATYEIKSPCAWDDLQPSKENDEAVASSDAFIYGSLVARSSTSRDTLFGLLDKSKFNVFDVNLRPPHYTQTTLLALMKSADLIKFNDDEIFEICAEMGSGNKSMEECIKLIAQSTNTKQICVTLGKEGAVLFIDDKFTYSQGYQVTVADTVGAGDSFLAALISKLLMEASPQEALNFACAVGAIVASKSGANPMISDGEIKSLMIEGLA